MPPRPIINDALWACLCPRYSLVPIAPISRTRVAVVRRGNKQLRAYQTATTGPDQRFSSSNRFANASSNGSSNSSPDLLRRSFKEPVPLAQLSIPELYERLRMDGSAGRYEAVMNVLKILIKDRRERPNAAMFAALIHSYTNCEEGTGGKLRKLLSDMSLAGIELDQRGAECMLEALAVHPDYLLRTDILEYMKSRWFNLSDRTYNFLVAGMLRDRLFEQALEMLDQMVRERIQVEAWLWDKAMWILLEYGEVEEAYYVLSQRHHVEGLGAKLSDSLWQLLLDQAANRHLAPAVKMVWNNQVVPGYLKPPTGTCLDVLSVAARTGNIKLATDVFRVLAERETVLTSHHYEALIECYLVANDLSGALSVILIMKDSGVKVTSEGLHPLFTYLRKQETRPMEAFTVLQEFANSGRIVPTVAVNTCIKASISLNRLAEAIEIFKALHMVSNAGANTETFNTLLSGCHRDGRKELALFLANEMVQLDIKPDRITYDRLMMVCMNASDMNDALLYYEEMKANGFVPRRSTYEKMINKSIEAGDGRSVALVKDYAERSGAEKDRVAMFQRMVRWKFEDNRKAPPANKGAGTTSS